jgi:hypothetical protein
LLELGVLGLTLTRNAERAVPFTQHSPANKKLTTNPWGPRIARSAPRRQTVTPFKDVEEVGRIQITGDTHLLGTMYEESL